MKFKRGYYDVFVNTCANYPSNIAIRHYNNGLYKNYTYSELYGVCEYISQNLQQLNCNKGIIGLITERNIIVPCIIAAAHKCCTTFMFLDPSQDLEPIISEIKFNFIISIKNADDLSSTEIFNKRPEKTITVFNLIIHIYNLQANNLNNSQYGPEYSFIAMTSGSTGDPKHIQVPIKCIQPNVDDLTKLFDIEQRDIIYFSTPLTFDPSMIEILLACMNGASLMIAPEKTDILFPENPDNSITFWQTTPSKFFQFSNADIRNKILSVQSTLKILALGGEPLNGIKRLKELKHANSKTKIFALYGVTEMSCWACVAELDLTKIQNDKEVPLGNSLSETNIVVEPQKQNKSTGKIILMSKTRKCVILNKTKGVDEENSLKFIDTGDMGEIRNGTIYYRGRRDDTIKRFGHKVNLQLIESTIMQCPRVKTCSCVWLPKPLLLVVYFSSETLSSQELSDFLKCKLDDKHWPDKIIRVDNLPTNPHGKISRQILAQMFEKILPLPQSVSSLKLLFLKELKFILNRNFTYEEIKDKDYFSLGGTSFLAISMCNKLCLTCPQFGKLILPHLLSRKSTIEDIMQLAVKELGMEIKPKKRLKRPRSNTESFLSTTQSIKKATEVPSSSNPIDFVVAWSYDTGKCVDASPSLYQHGYKLYVSVGSHSGKIVVIDAISGLMQGLIKVKSRVEAAVYCTSEAPLTAPCGVVGTYDGTIVCFMLESCKELWRINIGCMIKSKATCCRGELYIASYDGNVRCIDVLNGKINEVVNITDQAISADLVLAKKEFVLLGTLSGVCASIHTETKTIVWRGTLSSPVFATPVLYDNDKYVVFAEVNGEIHCRTVEKGIKIWKYQGAKGNIFSSICVREMDKLKWQMIFGCHDNKVYNINIKNFQPSLNWKAELTSPVYSTPCSLSDKLILTASNNGILCILDADSGMIVAEYHLPNETFSTPAVYGDYIYIGCRNDHLFAIKYVLNL
ncbi:beta-alanine-activating enzyme [Colias croceus]|uniref:beta-alanine-activating enzyme n=1 Tax=Colias crocea TaxID=72248 RepID=UPI001E279F89|nr:beta-alanine-activating enzyme [Colias croceus]